MWAASARASWEIWRSERSSRIRVPSRFNAGCLGDCLAFGGMTGHAVASCPYGPRPIGYNVYKSFPVCYTYPMTKRILSVLWLVIAVACGGSSPSSPSPASRILNISGSLTFGDVLVGIGGTASLTIANTGTAPLNITGMTGPSGLSASWPSGTIPAGASQIVLITFVPTAPGTYTGTLTINADQTSGTTTVSLSATAYPNLKGAWTGTLAFQVTVISGVGTVAGSNSCNEFWTINSQAGSQFSGTWQSTGGGGGGTTNCSQGGTFNGSVSTANSVSGLTYSVINGTSPLVGVATGCTRMSGDGVFNGVLAGNIVSLTTSDQLQCTIGFVTDIVNRSLSLYMRQ